MKFADSNQSTPTNYFYGELTPRDIRQITNIFVGENVEFILVVEKDTIYNLLWQAKFHEKHNCLIITRHGMPDERTISFVRMLEEKIDVPIFSIIDLYAYRSLIIKTYVIGSNELAHDNFKFAAISIH